MKTTANISELETALAAVNKMYKGNVVLLDPHCVSKNRIQFRLSVNNSSDTGSRIGHSGRRVKAACWHVHGHFFDELFKINPECFVLAQSKRITKEEGNWQDWNIGSIMNPMYFSEACDC